MSVHKVPQDVEAEDKLIGPFSFRQFVYLIIAAGGVALSVFLVQGPLPLPFFSIFTIPIGLGFLILALPLRKDQPMEIYLVAMIRFFLKPKRRLWMQDGSAAGVVIDAPRTVTQQLTKDLSQDEAINRLSYLSRIVDTRGWAAKGVDIPLQTSLNTAVVDEAFQAEDVLDENANISRSFDQLIAKQKQTAREAAIEKMHELQQNNRPVSNSPSPTPSAQQPQPVQTQTAPSVPTDESMPNLHFNPYPNMHQRVLQPLSALPADEPVVATKKPTPKPEKSMTPQVSPDIMRLANNNDLSIQAIANEAHRLEKDEEEVVISLR